MRTVAEALVVVDVQRALVGGPHAVRDADAFVSRVSEVVAAARAAGVLVVQLQDDGASPGSLIPKGLPGWRLAVPPAEGEPVVQKARDDGFDGTELEVLLREAEVSVVAVVGIQSEMCVAATARGALARGWTVVLPRDGHTTFDVPGDGAAPPVAAELVSRVAEWSLGDEVIAPDRVADVAFARPGTERSQADGAEP